jgi:hypothetical protein
VTFFSREVALHQFGSAQIFELTPHMLRRADGVADSYIIDASIRTLTAQACRKVLILIDTCLRGAQVASIHNTSVNTCELVRRDSAWDDKGHAKAQNELRNIDVVTAEDEPAATHARSFSQ